ncbi:MAG: cytochrome bc complex cytochrome b subunit [Deltaproteobacteria bacterium]|nr:MAG: cytochrome bc complex cytochrome b subunit [Deltaproteobacteria bacterium]
MKNSRQKRNIFVHARPQTVPVASLRFRLTWGLGGAAVLMVVIQLVTGILLNFSYEPTAQGAYASVQHVHYDVLLGRLIRNLHHWTGHALVIIVFLHMLRVFFSSAFRGARHLNWVIGLSLFFLILLANFSGYLLPWDQRSYWAVTIATSMLEYLPGIGPFLLELVRGGSEVGASTLHIFHALHSGVLPFLLLFLMLWHFWKIRRAGGLFLEKGGDGDNKLIGTEGETGEKVGQKDGSLRLTARPHLFIREKAAAAVVLAVLFYVAIFFNAHLGAQANPGLTPETVKAPWYFIAVQELLIHLNPIFVLLILAPAVVFFLLFFPVLKSNNRFLRPLFIGLMAGYIILTFTGLCLRGPGMQWIF